MAKKKGICKNVDGCSKARNRELQEAEESTFLCDECGEPLVPYDDSDNSNNSNVGLSFIFIIIAILCVIAIIAFYIFGERVDERIDLRQEGIYPQTEVYSEPNPVVVPEPLPMDSQGEMLANQGTLTMPYGSYTGGITDGYPDGEGRLVYRIRARIAERDSLRFADPGQYIIGRWRRGELMEGNLYDENGNKLYGFNWW